MTEAATAPDMAPDMAPDIATAMRLRADPPRVTRVSRKVIAGLGVAAGLGIGGALIYALQAPRPIAQPTELLSTERRPPADGLRDLPGSYDAIPRRCRAIWAVPSLMRNAGACRSRTRR